MARTHLARAWPAGTRVTHAKLGDGVVESATGRGDGAKLVVRFADGAKTLLAKFLARAT